MISRHFGNTCPQERIARIHCAHLATIEVGRMTAMEWSGGDPEVPAGQQY